MKEYLMQSEDVLAQQGVSATGLSTQEAGRRLKQYGPNKLKEGKKKSLLSRFFAELANPMLLILIGAAAVSAVTSALSGEPFTDVIIILAVVVINSVLGVLQESKAEAAIAALQLGLTRGREVDA